MKFFYIISFFLFMNFMLMLLPRLMPNVINASQVIFWIIWVNAIFIFTLVLPHQASYIFPFKSGVTIFKMFKKITNTDDSSGNDEKIDNDIKNAAAKKVQAIFRQKRATQLKNVIPKEKTLAEKIDDRRNPKAVVAPAKTTNTGATPPAKPEVEAKPPAKPPEKTETPSEAKPPENTGATPEKPSEVKVKVKTGAPPAKPEKAENTTAKKINI